MHSDHEKVVGHVLILYPVYMDHRRLTKVLTMINLISDDQEAVFSIETKIRKEKSVNLILS